VQNDVYSIGERTHQIADVYNFRPPLSAGSALFFVAAPDEGTATAQRLRGWAISVVLSRQLSRVVRLKRAFVGLRCRLWDSIGKAGAGSATADAVYCWSTFRRRGCCAAFGERGYTQAARRGATPERRGTSHGERSLVDAAPGAFPAPPKVPPVSMDDKDEIAKRLSALGRVTMRTRPQD
jgi:hypothetical protein